MYWRFAEFPASVTTEFLDIRSSGQGRVWAARLKSSGVLTIGDSSAVDHDTSATLSINTWYRISFAGSRSTPLEATC